MTKQTSSQLPLAIKDYLHFINSSQSNSKNILTKTKVAEHFDDYCNIIDLFLGYPDRLVDIMTPRDSNFELYFVQRIVLRAMARHRQSYHTFTRAFSKSFLAFLSRYIQTMLIPRHFSFVVSGTKQQAAQIAKEKITMDLWNKFPLLANEMQNTRVAGKLQTPYIIGKDYAEFRFTHGGRLDVVGSGSSTRGGRRHSGIFEEVIEHDGQEINEVIIPLMNTERRNAQGTVNPNEPHGSKIFVTTAGYQGTYAYEKLIETICYSVIDPKRYMVLGGSYEIPLMHGLLDPEAMMEVLSSPSYEQDSIDREYKSIWSGSPVGAAFGSAQLSDLRKVVRAETKSREEKDTEAFYVISADMAKDGSANTALVVWRVIPQEFSFLYTTVNVFQINSSDYEKVAAEIKHAIKAFNAALFIYDANGIGAALRDWLNKEQFDAATNTMLPAYGIINPPDKSRKDIETFSKDRTICYEIKAVGDVAGHINKIFFSKMGSKNIRFLIKKEYALEKFQKNKNFLSASSTTQKGMLRPYLYMDKLEEEMKNLDIKDISDRMNPHTLLVSQRNKKIQKDFYSAASYGVYGVHTYIEVAYYSKKRKGNASLASYIMKM